MIAFDTNYLARHLTRDDEKQFQIVAEVIRTEVSSGRQIFLSDVVLCELVWVLRRIYGASRSECLKAIEQVSQDFVFCFEERDRIVRVVGICKEENLDFSDALIHFRAVQKGCRLLTFDRKLKATINRLS